MTEKDESASTAKKRSERTCAGCGKHAPPAELVRVVLDPQSGELAVDVAGSGFGRGAHFHPSLPCLTKALKGGFARVFKTRVVGEAEALGDALVAAADRRIEGLLAGARRAGQLAVGADAVEEALREDPKALVVLARDAAAATRLTAVDRAIAEGRAIAFADKVRIGALVTSGGAAEGREVAVVAVRQAGVAAAVQATYRMSGPFRRESASTSVSRSEEAWSSSSEVR